MSDTVLQKNQILGQKYRIDRPIGSGGFSEVYLATHTAMERVVAIKVFDPGTDEEQESGPTRRRLKRFEQEARLVSQLKHPNTITIYDFGSEPDGKLYLVMEYVEGPTFQEVLRSEAPLHHERALSIFMQILRSLEEAHRAGIMHRDLKPANIMLTRNFKGEEVVKVLDFGIAQIVNKHTQELGPNGRPIFLGTPRYAAPEQLLARPLSHATDTYAVGALFWEALLGTPLVSARDLTEYVRLATDPIPHRLPEGHHLPREITAVLQKSVQKSPQKRYPDASAMLRALEDATTLRREDLPRPDRSPFRPNREILDPNITDPQDEENYFLSDAPRPQPPESRPKNTHPRPGARPKSSGDDLFAPVPEPEREDLFASISEPVEVSHSQGSSPPPASDKKNPEKKSPKTRPQDPPQAGTKPIPQPSTSSSWDKRFLLLLLPFFLVTALGAVLLFAHHFSESNTAADPESLLDRVTDPPSERTRPPSPFTVGGIQSALVASNQWRITDRRDSVDMQRFVFHPLVLTKENTILDVTIYEVLDSSARGEITENIRFPSEYVTLGPFIVRLTPRDSRGHESTVDLREDLLLYRELVLQEVNRQ